MRYEILVIQNNEVIESHETDSQPEARDTRTLYRIRYPDARIEIFENEWFSEIDDNLKD